VASWGGKLVGTEATFTSMGKPACRRHTLARATAAHAHCMHHARRGRSSCWGVARHPLAPVFLRVRRLRLQSCSIHTISDLGLEFLCSSGLGSRLAAQPTLRDDRKAVHDSRLLRLGPGTSNCGDTPACDARELCNLVPCRKRNTPVVSRITHHTTAIHRSLPVACSRQRAHVLEHSLVAINCRRCARRRHVRVDRLKVQLISAKQRWHLRLPLTPFRGCWLAVVDGRLRGRLPLGRIHLRVDDGRATGSNHILHRAERRVLRGERPHCPLDEGLFI